MDSALRSTVPRPELVTDAATLTAGKAPAARALTATAVYGLSEAGRKASLLTGGDGRAVQQITLQVPANRLHLVNVSARGIARLKLRPRFVLDGQEEIVCHDTPPMYDSPPTIDELLREAARNHELERAFYAQRTARHGKHRELDREWRIQIALAFFEDQTERALPQPPVTPSYCYLATERGAVRFDINLDHGPARQVPTEAYRRFRADVEVARERRRREREEKDQTHEEKKQAIAAWIAEHGTADQRGRQNAGVLPMSEACEAITDHALRALADRPQFLFDGAARLQAYLRQFPQYADAVVTDIDLAVDGGKAPSATSAQWALLQDIQAAVPDASVTLHVRDFIWKRDRKAPKLRHFTVLVTTKVGPVSLRREYLGPDG
jgi:hypothetical protein